MALFDRLSRYAKPPLTIYQAVDVRGRTVSVLPVPDAPTQVSAGIHVRKQGETLDQLAFGFLADAHAYWRLCELNDAIIPDSLAEVQNLQIPAPNR
jgi:hypothetical protein